MARRHCKACGNGATTLVRAMVVKSDTPLGLVCKHCARCGLLVVSAALVMLPAKPRRVPRTELTKALSHVPSVLIGGKQL